MQDKSLAGWLDYIGRQHSAEIVMGLDRVREVWARMGKPQAPRNIIVGGTNGKGSTCAMLESIYAIAGYKTGFYTSPHLLRYNERVRLNRTDASDTKLCAAFAAVEAARITPTLIPFTYFEYATLSALWLFAEEKVEVALLEVGMGGRLDAVNLVDADVSIVTSVDLDHQGYLGNTREQIAWEKAHIYRTNRPAIFADHAAPETLKTYAETLGAELIVLNRDYRFSRMDNQWQFLMTHAGSLHARHALPLPALRGDYQLKNASAALAAITCLGELLPVSLNHIKRGLLEVEWPGRLQVLPGRPTVVLDVAHNPHAARALADAMGSMGYFENTYAVFAMLKDKDMAGVIDALKGRVDRWFIAGLPTERGASAEQIAALLRAQKCDDRIVLCSTVTTAYQAAREMAKHNDRILVFGSFYTVADVLATSRSAT